MTLSDYTLSDAALRALDSILPSGAFDVDAPSFILHDVLAYLKDMHNLTPDEIALLHELEAMPDLARECLSRAIAAARRKE